MARRPYAIRLPDEAGNAVGGSPYELRVYTDEALTSLATVYSNGGAGGAMTLPLIPNAGGQTTLTTNMLTTDTTAVVADVSTFSTWQRIRFYDGTSRVWRTITNINSGTKTLTLDSAIGIAFQTSNTVVNGPGMKGLVGFWVDDTADYYITVLHVATGEIVHWSHVPIRAPSSPIDVQDEGTLVNNRAKLNFIGARVTATDDVPNTRINVTIPNPMTTLGDIIIGGASGAETRLAIGATGQAIKVVSGSPAWANATPDVQTFTASGSWTKPAGALWCEVDCFGAGGGGGGGEGRASGIVRGGGGSAGGGAHNVAFFAASTLGATETVTIGASGTAGTGAGASANGGQGGAGGTTTFGSHLGAFGGGGGGGNQGGSMGQGGGGGGVGSVGTSATSVLPNGGEPHTYNSGSTPVSGFGGGGGDAGANPASAEWGGGGGNGQNATVAGGAGAGSIHGGPAGGQGGGVTAGNAASGGGAGGAFNNFGVGGGGAGGAAGVAGTAGTSRSGTGKAGDGGGGAGGDAGAVGKAGGAGGAPAAGGGGGGGGTNGGGNGGLGGRGEVIVTTYF